VLDPVRLAREQDRQAADAVFKARLRDKLGRAREVDRLGLVDWETYAMLEGEHRVIRAKIESVCAICERQVKVGHVVTWFYNTDSGRTVVCGRCQPTSDEPRRAAGPGSREFRERKKAR
jgi:hypothetical protein